MKRSFFFKQTFSTTPILLLAFFLAACGNSSNGPALPEYTGVTTQATITADNAEDIATKAIVVGYLNDITASDSKALTGVTQSLNGQDDSLSKSMTKMSSDILTRFADIFFDDFIPQQTQDDTFPNVSGEYSPTYASDDDKTFTITHTFVDAKHYESYNSGDNLNIDIFNGTVIETITFDYDEGDITFEGSTAEEKYQELRDAIFISTSGHTITCNQFRHTETKLSNPDTTSYDPNLIATGFGGYSLYHETDESSYELDGSYTEESTTVNTFIEEFGEYNRTYTSSFTGSIEATRTETDDASGQESVETDSLTLTEGHIAMERSSFHTRTTGDVITDRSSGGLPTKASFTYSLPDYEDILDIIDMPMTNAEMVIQGNITYITTDSDDEDAEETTLTVGNTAGNLLYLKNSTEFTSIDDAATGNSISDDYVQEASLKIHGNAQVTRSTTDKAEDPAETATITLSLSSGDISFSGGESSREEYTVIEDTNPWDTYEEAENYLVSLSGTLTANLMGTTITLSGAASLESNMDYQSTQADGTIESIDTLLLTVNNLRLTAPSMFLALHGTAEYTMDWATTPDHATVDLNMVFLNNDKSYLYDNYIVTLPPPSGDEKGSKISIAQGISITGKFYHHDYGFVNVSTGTPYVLGKSRLPTSGAHTISGADNTSATLTATYEVIDESPVYGYTVSMDGEDIVTDGTWPDMNSILGDLPFLSEIRK